MISKEARLVKTSISYRTVLYGVVGSVFFGTFAYLLITLEWSAAKGTDPETAQVMAWVFRALFIFFALCSLFSAFNTKTFQLTNDELVIIRPLLLTKSVLPLSTIRRLSEEEFKINPATGSSRINVYEGKQLIIEFANSKKIKMNSYEVAEYSEFRNKLSALVRRYDIKQTLSKDYIKSATHEGYGWLAILILLTLGLVISLVSSKA